MQLFWRYGSQKGFRQQKVAVIVTHIADNPCSMFTHDWKSMQDSYNCVIKTEGLLKVTGSQYTVIVVIYRK